MAVSRKDREKLFKQREILTAAREVFAEKGYEHATIEEIAQRAEFSKAALYHYFQNKEEIFVAALEEIFSAMEKNVAAAFDNQLPVREKFRRFTVELFRHYEEHTDFLAILIKEELQMRINLLCQFREKFLERREKIIAKMAAALKKAMKAGTIRKMDAVKLVEAYRSMAFGLILLQRFHHDNKPLLTEVDTLLTIFFDGVTAQ